MTNNQNNSGDCNSGHCNSGYCNSGDYNSGHYNSGDCNSGDCNSGDCNSGYCNSGDYNSGDHNSGYYNSGHYNSGYFNSDTPNIRIFNQESNLKFDSEILFNLRELIQNKIKFVCTWIYESDMSNEEKEEFPTHKTTGGYLKKRDYKYCWKKGWDNMSEEDKDFIKSLPNFNKEIFKEITGIDIKENETKSIIIDGKEIKISAESFESLKEHFINSK